MTSRLLIAALLAALAVMAATIVYLSMDLPDQTGETLNYPPTSFNFAFGSGHPIGERMHIDEFANGYALLSSGPVEIQADMQRVLVYTWIPTRLPQEAAFFWRRSDDPQEVLRTDITAPGTNLIDLSTEPDWQGEITEFGFLVAGENGETVEIGTASLKPDSLNTRLQLMWRAWTTFEVWSQQSINFIHGGDHRQVVPLPLLIGTWFLITLVLLWLFTRFGKAIGSRELFILAGMLFLIAWVLLDVRWSVNNLRQIYLSFQTQWTTNEQQRSSIDLDGQIYQYIHRLKTEVLGNQPARILILGDESVARYYRLRAKYHLLPHSVYVARRFDSELDPESLDFVIFFGQGAGIQSIRGWNQSWQRSLVRIDRGQWGVVYRVGYTNN